MSATWRSALLGSAVLATLVSGRFAFDTFAPPSNWGPRSTFSTWSAIAVYLVVGFWSAAERGGQQLEFLSRLPRM